MTNPTAPQPAVLAIAAAYGLLSGCLFILGWATGTFSGLTAGIPYVSMKPNTAVCFVLAGASLWLHGRGRRARLCLLATAGGALVALTGALTLAEHVLSIHLGIDELLFRDVAGAGPHPGRMAPTAAASFILLGAALLGSDAKRERLIEAVQVLAVLAGLIGVMGLAGYLYAMPLPHWSLSYTTALPTSVGLIVCSLGLLALHAQRGLVAVVASESAGGAAARRLLPWAVAGPLIIGWAVMAGQRVALYDVHVSIAWMTFGSVVVFVTVVWANAYALHKVDRGRHAATVALDQSVRRVAASEERYRALMEYANDAILIMDLGGQILEVNRETERLLGRPREKIVGRRYDTFVAPHEREEVARRWQGFVAEGAVRVESRQLVRADGSNVSVEVSGSAVRLGDEMASLTILRDVTERRRAEEAVRRSEARMRSVLDAALDALVMMDVNGVVVSWNARAEVLFGWSADEARGRTLSDLIIPPRYREAHIRGLRRFVDTGESRVIGRRIEISALRRDGSEFPVELTVTALQEGNAFLFNAFIADITERKSAEEAVREARQRLEQSEEQYRLLFDSNPHSMWVYDPVTLAFLAVNDAAVTRYGWSREEFLGRTVKDIRPPEDVAAFLAVVEEDLRRPHGTSEPQPFRHLTKDGTVIDVEISGTPITFRGRAARLVLAVDVTERKQMEAQLVKAQKMEAVGQLAGGVAHDFNNLLGVITGYSDLLMRELPAGSRERKRSQEIKRAADRAAALTRQLLAFSRRQVLQPRVLDLNAVVADVEKMLRRLISENVQIITVFGADLGRVRADAGQLEQVIINLSINARDAMPSGGKLVIETDNAELDDAYVRTHPDARVGSHVMLAVSDTGHGMDAETIAHIFEPFFTTKSEGRGTGLGLATVYGIVRQSGGTVTVYSEPGRGTTFRVYLPRDDAELDAAVVAAMPAPSGGVETVLIVEDADALRLLIRELLQAAGYTVLEASEPERALDAARDHAGPIHLLLTDVVLPRMNGPELAKRLAHVKPDMRVLFMSGYTDQAIGHQGVLDPAVAYLQKPFTMEALLRKIRETLVSA